MSTITLQVRLTTEEAASYAQILKRTTFFDYSDMASSYAEATLAHSAAISVREALAEKGFSPK